MEKRYRVLRLVVIFYKVLGVLIAVIAILAAVFSIVAVVVGGTSLRAQLPQVAQAYPILSAGGVLGMIAGILVLLAGMLITAALTYATGEGISALVDIEENTRATGILLRQIRQGSGTARRQEPPPAVS